MSSIRFLFPLLTGSLAAALVVAGGSASAGPDAAPWGVSASASSFKDHAEWFPKMAGAGVGTVRLFPEWRSVEPKKGTWNWQDGDALVKDAADSNLEISAAVLMGSPPGGRKPPTPFPMDDLDGWSEFVTTAVERYHKQIHYWEIWNEWQRSGFNDGHNTTS